MNPGLHSEAQNQADPAGRKLARTLGSSKTEGVIGVKKGREKNLKQRDSMSPGAEARTREVVFEEGRGPEFGWSVPGQLSGPAASGQPPAGWRSRRREVSFCPRRTLSAPTLSRAWERGGK